MNSLVALVRSRLESPVVRKLIKYSMVSVIAVIVTLVVQVICFGVIKIDAAESAVIASTIAAVPSYFLNRMWVWRKNGRSHMTREVLPFWIMFVIGLVASAGASAFAKSLVDGPEISHAMRTFVVTGASFLAFAALWVGKFILFNKVLFVHHPQDLDPALDGRTGVPT